MICSSCGAEFQAPPKAPKGGKPRSRCDACRSSRAWLDGTTYRNLREQVLREETGCHLCGQPVDKSIQDRADPRVGQVDHVVPVADRPDLANERSNLRLAHRLCNLRKGAGPARGTGRKPVPQRQQCPDCGSYCGPNLPGAMTHWCL
ncbi:HNH endonuclease [Kribbella aluminosa]|uniref:HNH endonuclease n=1 Tax=Kribbella aluminosa TaxID=416017 RepID=UPI00337C48BF